MAAVLVSMLAPRGKTDIGGGRGGGVSGGDRVSRVYLAPRGTANHRVSTWQLSSPCVCSRPEHTGMSTRRLREAKELASLVATASQAPQRSEKHVYSAYRAQASPRPCAETCFAAL